MATLAKPPLRRTAATQPIRASFFDDTNDARNSPAALQLRSKVTTASGNSPFRGPVFRLPSGAVVVEDMWAASLDVAIDEVLDSGLDGLKSFADETSNNGWVLGWLQMKVTNEGNDQQKQQFHALKEHLNPSIPGAVVTNPPIDEYVRAGLPSDIYTDVVHQPLQEVEVYRDLPMDFEMPDEEDDDEAEAPAPASADDA
jgi:hypothetical protein